MKVGMTPLDSYTLAKEWRPFNKSELWISFVIISSQLSFASHLPSLTPVYHAFPSSYAISYCALTNAHIIPLGTMSGRLSIAQLPAEVLISIAAYVSSTSLVVHDFFWHLAPASEELYQCLVADKQKPSGHPWTIRICPLRLRFASDLVWGRYSGRIAGYESCRAQIHHNIGTQ